MLRTSDTLHKKPGAYDRGYAELRLSRFLRSSQNSSSTSFGEEGCLGVRTRRNVPKTAHLRKALVYTGTCRCIRGPGKKDSWDNRRAPDTEVDLRDPLLDPYTTASTIQNHKLHSLVQPQILPTASSVDSTGSGPADRSITWSYPGSCKWTSQTSYSTHSGE